MPSSLGGGPRTVFFESVGVAAHGVFDTEGEESPFPLGAAQQPVPRSPSPAKDARNFACVVSRFIAVRKVTHVTDSLLHQRQLPRV